eukprot:NODE_6_length_48303_cov_0.387022.p11 type:complete len:295 gc:universal NODE_6_length_48303_cov_0.387022:30850-29966(-)
MSQIRDLEYQEILDFVRSESKFMYISGIPGCGKTFTVKRLKNLNYINCMCDNIVLNEKINVLDEIDNMSKQNWELVFDHVKNGFKVIGIANTLDIGFIPDELINDLQLVSFPPYNASELTEIAGNIVSNMDIQADSKILDFLGRKCSNIDGDVRRLQSWIKCLPENPTIKDVIEVTKSSQITRFHAMPIHAKHLLCLLYLTFVFDINKQKRIKKVSFQQLYQKCKPLYKNKHSVPLASYSEFIDLLNVLESKSFVNIRKGNVELDDSVESSLFSNDDVTKSLYYSNIASSNIEE